MKTLAVIPARGGSKGVKHKNNRLLAGRHILEHTISHCLACKDTDVVVSTDDDAIEAAAQRLNVRVIRRNLDLATDHAISTLAVVDAARQLQAAGRHFDLIAEMSPCVPVRPTDCLQMCVRSLAEKPEFHSAISLEDAGTRGPNYCVQLTGEQELQHPWGYVLNRRQDATPSFLISGAAYVVRSEVILDETWQGLSASDPYRFFGRRRLGVPFPKGTTVDIDTELDMLWAEYVLSRM